MHFYCRLKPGQPIVDPYPLTFVPTPYCWGSTTTLQETNASIHINRQRAPAKVLEKR
jgi:hypothetical protein